MILARHARRLVNLLDDTPVVPGDTRATTFEHSAQARQVLTDAEEDLRDWAPSVEDIQMQSKGMSSNLMPQEQAEKVAEKKLTEDGGETAAEHGATGSEAATSTGATAGSTAEPEASAA